MFKERKSPFYESQTKTIQGAETMRIRATSFILLHSSSKNISLPFSCCCLSDIIRSVARDGWGSMLGTCVSRQACCRMPWSTTTWLWSCSGGLMTSSGWVVSLDNDGLQVLTGIYKVRICFFVKVVLICLWNVLTGVLNILDYWDNYHSWYLSLCF